MVNTVSRFFSLQSVQGRLGLLFLTFFLLLSVSVGATFFGIDSQKRDGLVINLAGRQRMLVQWMARLALEMGNGGGQEQADDLRAAMRTFEGTLTALQHGGNAPYSEESSVEVPAARSAEIQAQLHLVQEAWEALRDPLEKVAAGQISGAELAEAVTETQRLSQAVVARADEAVRLYEQESAEDMEQLRLIQAAFFASALLLLAAGAWLTRQSVLAPLKAIQAGAQRVGAGDLETPLQVRSPAEFATLAVTFNSMQAQLHASREAMTSWAEELEGRVAQRTRELEALYEVSRDISSRLDVRHVLNSVTEKARELLQAEVASLCLLEDSTEVLTISSHSGPPDAVVGNSSLVEGGIAGPVLSSTEAVACGEYQCSAACSILSSQYRASHLVAPLRVGSRVIGALCVGSRQPGAFSEKACPLLGKLANSAAIALENARLYAQAERVATLEERQRIAADMHDSLGQTLSYLSLSMDQVGEYLRAGDGARAQENLEASRQALNQANLEVRRAISSLMEDPPLRRSLQEQLAALVDECTAMEGPQVAWRDALGKALHLPQDKAEQVLRVAREAVINAQRHAGAQRVQVVFQENGGEYQLSVQDDGCGFDTAILKNRQGNHFGLRIMQARAGLLGGNCSVESAPGEGTRVMLRWPKHRQRPEAERQHETYAHIIG